MANIFQQLLNGEVTPDEAAAVQQQQQQDQALPQQGESYDPNVANLPRITVDKVSPPVNPFQQMMTGQQQPGPVMSPAPDDKYRAAAIAEQDRQKALGDPGFSNITESLGRGAGMGWLDEAMALGTIPGEMIKQGTINPIEAYRYAKAREDLKAEQVEKQGARVPYFGWNVAPAAQLLGGLSTAGSVLGSGSRAANPVANYFANIGKAGALGGVVGAGEAPDIKSIPANAGMGAVFGGVTGAALPAIPHALGWTANILQAPRLLNPQAVAESHMANLFRTAGITPNAVAAEVGQANAFGQPYMAADALGHEGQRALAAMAKTPGPQREDIIAALRDRTTNMPARTSGEINRSLGVEGTAQQAQDALISRAKTQAAPLYSEAETHPTWSNRLQEFLDFTPYTKAALAKGYRIQQAEAIAEGKPFNPTDAMITDFDAAGDPIISGVPNVRTLNMIKTGLDRMIEDNTSMGRVNAEGRAQIKFKNAMLNEMDAINPVYGKARATFADPMQIKDAVQRGVEMKSTGRASDNIAEFRGMREGEQQGARIGYADAVNKQLEGTGNFPSVLRQKSIKGSNELREMSRDQGPLRPGEADRSRKFLNREERMLETTNKAGGGSATAENIADMTKGPGGADVFGIATNVLTGNLGGATRGVMGVLKDMATGAVGANEAQRLAITRALMERDPSKIQQMGARIADYELRRRGVNPWTGTYRIPPGQ